MQKEILILYEYDQVSDAVKYIESLERAPEIIALDFWVEQGLKDHNLPFLSIASFEHYGRERTTLLRLAEDFAREWYRLPECNFFSHRDILLGEPLELMIDSYVQSVLYFLSLLQPIMKQAPQKSVILIPHTKRKLGHAAGPLDFFELDAPVDAAALLSELYDHSFQALGTYTPPNPRPLCETRNWRHFALSCVNKMVSLLVPSRSIKIYASEYWSHIAPLVPYIEDTELTLMDRHEIANISVPNLFSGRIRFMHMQDRLSTEILQQAKHAVENFKQQWPTVAVAISKLADELSEGSIEVPWWKIVEKRIEHIVCSYAERMIADADSIECILKELQINRVLLRAGMSGRQHHFLITACIAHQLGIPSIEVQHGENISDPHSPASRLYTSYLAAYGDITKKTYVQNQHLDPDRIRAVGSPRFDAYTARSKAFDYASRAGRLSALHLDPDKPVVVAVCPTEDSGVVLSPARSHSYDVAEFFRTFKRLQTDMPEAQVIFKFRPGRLYEHNRHFVNELFQNGKVAVTDGDLFSFLILADVVVSPDSTAILETVITGKPLVRYPWNPQNPHAKIYEALGPMFDTHDDCTPMVMQLLNDRSFCSSVLTRQKNFLKKEFSFDEHAAERVAALIQEPLKTFPPFINSARMRH